MPSWRKRRALVIVYLLLSAEVISKPWPTPDSRDEGNTSRILQDLASPSNIVVSLAEGFGGAKASWSRKLAEIQTPPLWEWPKETIFTAGSLPPVTQSATLQAFVSYPSITFKLPNDPCNWLTTGNIAGTGPDQKLVLHSYEASSPWEVKIRLTRYANVVPSIFIGASLQDGYEINIDQTAPTKSVINRVCSRTVAPYCPTYTNPVAQYTAGAVLAAVNSATDIWLSFTLDSGVGTIRIGKGDAVGYSEILSYADNSPPQDFGNLWVTGPGTNLGGASVAWLVCLTGNSKITLSNVVHSNPMMKFVHGSATRDDCHSTLRDSPMLNAQNGIPTSGGGQASIYPLPVTISEESVAYQNGGLPVRFMHGGSYRLCYKPHVSQVCTLCVGLACKCFKGLKPCTTTSRSHGTCNAFEDDTTKFANNLMPIDLKVHGVGSGCTSDDCLQKERWDCHYGHLGEDRGLCKFDISKESGRNGWSITDGSVSKMTWSAVWQADTMYEGQLQGLNPKACGTTADISKWNMANHSVVNEFRPTSLGIVTMPPVKTSMNMAFSVTACYCPNYDGNGDGTACNEQTDFLQQFGILYMWISHICDISNYLDCTAPYFRVVPQQKFVLKVICPPGGGCLPSASNRVKFIVATGKTNAPVWDASHVCKHVRAEPEQIIWPLQEDSLNLDGGVRVDYKAWWGKQVSIDETVNRPFEVCFCNENCEVVENWFKVGQVRTVYAFGLASRTKDASDGSAIDTVKYVNKAGSFTLYGGITSSRGQPYVHPQDSNKYSGNALLNMLSVDSEVVSGQTLLEKYRFNLGLHGAQHSLDTECRKGRYSRTLVQGLSSASEAYERRAEPFPANADTVTSYMPFAGTSKTETMTVQKAGTLAVCYCGRVTPLGICLGDQHWIFAAMVQIHGPKGGQEWKLPTHTIVSIDGILGWGFHPTDRLRLVESGKCSDNDFQPDGNTDWCLMGLGSTATCVQAEATHFLDAVPASSLSTARLITDVHVESLTSTVLTFDGDILKYVNGGDTISINLDNIRIGGKDLFLMSDKQRHDATLLSGEAYFMDDLSRRYLRFANHVLTLDGSSDGNSDSFGEVSTKLRIPVGWGTDHPGGIPAFTLTTTVGKAQWVRRNIMNTEKRIRATTSKQRMKLCWTPLDSGGLFYGEAGEVTFSNPARMFSATLGLTTNVAGAVAPVLISFIPDGRSSAYATLKGELVLRVRFLGRGMHPAYADIATPGSLTSAIIAAGMQATEASMSQAICGQLFLELWSDSTHGFPVPRACYYGRKGGPGQPTERELIVVFDRFNGLRHQCPTENGRCEYQIVLNAQIVDVIKDEHVMSLYTECRKDTGCDSDPQMIEIGQVKATSGTQPTATSILGETLLHSLDGFELQKINSRQIVELKAPHAEINFKLKPQQATTSINQGALLRLYLWPLTLWDITVCYAKCFPDLSFNKTKCDGQTACTIMKVESGAKPRQNVLKVQLPDIMTPISHTVSHLIELSNLNLPGNAFFPIRLGVQLTNVSDQAASYTTSKGFLSYLDSKVPRGEYKLVVTDREGCGPSPFQADSNMLYVHLTFGVTLWNNGAASGDPPAFEIILPSGFTCAVLGKGAAPHRFADNGLHKKYALTLDPYDGDIENLFLLDHNKDLYADNVRSTLSTISADGSWGTSLRNKCIYVLGNYQVVHAGQQAVVAISVSNPTKPMQRAEANSTWSFQMKGRGNLNLGDLLEDVVAPFISVSREIDLGVEKWAGSVAVLEALPYVVVQPSSFLIGVTHWAAIFLRTVQSAGFGGEVVVIAPTAYSFGSPCSADDLEGVYYDLPQTGLQTFPLRDRGGCVAVKYPSSSKSSNLNRAHVRVNGNLVAGRTYGFKMKVTNPLLVSAVNKNSTWFLFTRDANGFSIDSTQGHATAFADDIWVPYATSLPEVTISTVGQTLQPFRSFFTTQLVAVEGISVASTVASTSSDTVMRRLADSSTSLRLTAPQGFLFRQPSGDGGAFEFQTNKSTAPLPTAPRLAGGNTQLLWPLLHLQPGKIYGFLTAVEISNSAPVQSSSHFFFLELGYNGAEAKDRIGATVVQAKPVAAIIGASVMYLTNQAGYRRNLLTFRFRIASTVPARQGSAIVIAGSQELRGFDMSCPVNSLQDSRGTTVLPHDSTCEFVVHGPGNVPVLMLKAQTSPILPGVYVIEVRSSTPPMAYDGGPLGTWSIGTVSDVTMYPASTPIDVPMVVPAPRLCIPMMEAMLGAPLAVPRDDRPGRLNTVTVSFRLELLAIESGELPMVSSLVLIAPFGFEFSESCFSSLVTGKYIVFGQNAEVDSWPIEYGVWPEASAPTACIGEGSIANMTVPKGLERQDKYAFQIAVTNPRQSPKRNHWTLQYDLEASEALPGFSLATFEFPTPLEAVDRAVGPGPPAPVTLSFKPTHGVPRGGKLHFTSPSGFVIQNATSLVELAAKGAQGVKILEITSEKLPGSSTLSVHLTHTSEMLPGRVYELEVLVRNANALLLAPVTWGIASFNVTSEPFDEGFIEGYGLTSKLQLAVKNMETQLRGTAPIRLRVELVIPADVLFGDDLVLQVPSGFKQDCSSFKWIKWVEGIDQPLPKCVCPSGACQMTMSPSATEKIMRKRDFIAVPTSFESLVFEFTSTNPAQTPPLKHNYWRARHDRAAAGSITVLSSGVLKSWQIQPQIASISIVIVGSNRASGAETDLLLSFVPVRDASAARLVAEYPTEFDFGRATLEPPLEKGLQSAGKTIVLTRLNLIGDIETSIKISSVQLGRAGGQSIFSLTTYKYADLETSIDEKLHFKGFRQPGRATVLSSSLASIYATQPEVYPGRSLLPARSGEQARAVFLVSFSLVVTFAQQIMITCEGAGAYQLFADNRFGISRLDPSSGAATPIPTNPTLQGPHSIMAVFLGSEPTAVAVGAERTIEIAVWVVPTLGVNNWRFETHHAAEWESTPTNTNDGDSAGFNPVAPMDMLIQARRSPPATIIEIRMEAFLDSAETSFIVPEMELIAPPGFNWPLDCGDMCEVKGLTLGETGREIATISAPAQANLLGMEINLLIKSPDRTPSHREWLVQARGLADGVVSWGVADGFKIDQMIGAMVSYGGISNLAGVQVVFSFEMTEAAGDRLFTTIEVTAPVGFSLSCRGDNLYPVSLPGSPPDCIRDGVGILRLELNETLTTGAYAFAVTASVPEETPDPNTFTIAIKERGSDIMIDASFDIPGQSVVPLAARPPTIAWTTAGIAGQSSVTIGISFQNITSIIRAFLVTLPPNFRHNIRTPTDLKSSNQQLPLPQGVQDRVDTGTPSLVRVLLDPADPLIAEGNYRFTFPVLMPETTLLVPRYNIWHLCLCSDKNCEKPLDPNTIVAFAMAGFMPGEVSVLEEKRRAAKRAKEEASSNARWLSYHDLYVSTIIMWLLTIGP